MELLIVSLKYRNWKLDATILHIFGAANIQSTC